MKVDRNKQSALGFPSSSCHFHFPHPLFTVPSDISSILLLQFAGRTALDEDIVSIPRL